MLAEVPAVPNVEVVRALQPPLALQIDGGLDAGGAGEVPRVQFAVHRLCVVTSGASAKPGAVAVQEAVNKASTPQTGKCRHTCTSQQLAARVDEQCAKKTETSPNGRNFLRNCHCAVAVTATTEADRGDTQGVPSRCTRRRSHDLWPRPRRLHCLGIVVVHLHGRGVHGFTPVVANDVAAADRVGHLVELVALVAPAPVHNPRPTAPTTTTTMITDVMIHMMS